VRVAIVGVHALALADVIVQQGNNAVPGHGHGHGHAEHFEAAAYDASLSPERIRAGLGEMMPAATKRAMVERQAREARVRNLDASSRLVLFCGLSTTNALSECSF
jgi:hypothetical protein